MFKLAVVIALIGFVCANPVPQDDATADAESAIGGFGNSQMPQFPKIEWPKFPQIPAINEDSIANLKPGPNGSVHGVSSSIKSETQWINGKPVTKSEGHYTINKNGVVESGSFPDNSNSSSSE